MSASHGGEREEGRHARCGRRGWTALLLASLSKVAVSEGEESEATPEQTLARCLRHRVAEGKSHGNGRTDDMPLAGTD